MKWSKAKDFYFSIVKLYSQHLLLQFSIGRTYKKRISVKLLGIISVGFDITDQLLIRYSAFVSY
jgi:hypothetical protein